MSRETACGCQRATSAASSSSIEHGSRLSRSSPRIGFGQPVQVAYQIVEGIYFLDDVIGRLGGRLQSIPQPLRFQLDDAQRCIEFVRDVINQPLTYVTLGLQGGRHLVE